MRCAVTGASGFIGSHLVRRLRRDGHQVLALDRVLPEFDEQVADETITADLAERLDPAWLDGVERLYALAADMGGMGYIHANGADIMRTNLRIDVNTLEAADAAGVGRVFYASSACVYNQGLQDSEDSRPLAEEAAYPADPDTDYGWEKLTAERLAAAYRRERGLMVSAARFHNVYGPRGTWRGGREKAPAAICRKVAAAKLRGEGHVEVWGDGRARRSFLFIDDCLEGILRLTEAGRPRPLNVGSDRSVSVDELVGIVAAAAGHPVEIRHVDGPQGVRGRNSDNAAASAALSWSPATSLEDGLAATYAWIEEQVRAALGRGEAV